MNVYNKLWKKINKTLNFLYSDSSVGHKNSIHNINVQMINPNIKELFNNIDSFFDGYIQNRSTNFFHFSFREKEAK